MQILVFDGSLGGQEGNTAKVLNAFQEALGTKASLKILTLSTSALPSRELLAESDAFVFATGTYWDSWGSPLQNFFEKMTPLEGDSCWLGKPAALITTMHSVGGKEVLNRLHGVINSFGLFVPPMCGFTYSFTNHLALQSPAAEGDAFADDLWRLEDLVTVSQNLLTAIEFSQNSQGRWSTWQMDHEDANRLWLHNRPNKRR